MKKFFFGSDYAKIATVCITLMLTMGLALPLWKLEEFQEAGTTGLWMGYWLFLIPLLLWSMHREKQKQIVAETFS